MPDAAAGPACFNCGTALADALLPIARHTTCPECFHELHCCRMCEHYRANESTTCAEDRAEVPTIKDNANFCEWFRLNQAAGSGGNKASDAKQALDDLFDNTPSDTAGPTLDDLFS